MFLIKLTQTRAENGYKSAKDDALLFPAKEYERLFDALDFLIMVYDPGGFSPKPAEFAISMYQDHPSGEIERSQYYTDTLTDHLKQLFKPEADQTIPSVEVAIFI